MCKLYAYKNIQKKSLGYGVCNMPHFSLNKFTLLFLHTLEFKFRKKEQENNQNKQHDIKNVSFPVNNPISELIFGKSV